SRLTIAFFAISGLDLLNALDDLDIAYKKNICEWIYRLQILPTAGGDKRKCGFQGSDTFIVASQVGATSCNPEYSAGHLAMTYTGLASLVILGDDLSRVNRQAIVKGVRALQQEDGSFCATLLGSENDMRFVYCAACVCYMLQDWSGMDMEKTISFIKKCMSYDYGLGQSPEVESHGGVTYCGVAALMLMGKLNEALTKKQLDGLRRWAIFRQQPGFQGRANKPSDTCYSFWIGATLKMLDFFHLVNFTENRRYIITTQDSLIGGFSKWADSYPDPMHTYLGLCGLSLMGEEGLQEINPALNMSSRAVKRLHKLHALWSSSDNNLCDSLQNSIVV
ncbi:hypothetical protein AAG570_004099, partial [Ranatra chinensis]